MEQEIKLEACAAALSSLSMTLLHTQEVLEEEIKAMMPVDIMEKIIKRQGKTLREKYGDAVVDEAKALLIARNLQELKE